MSPRASTDRLLCDVEINTESYSRSSHPDSFDISPERRGQIEKGFLRKLDLRVSFLVLVWLMNIVDRSTIAAARLHGFEEDLQLTGHQFNTLISIMYTGYLFMQIPSNMFLDRLTRPSAFLSLAILLWGLFSVTIGLARNFGTALVSRFFLGFSEAVYYPGILLLISRWYKRDEIGLRLAYLNCGSSVGQFLGALFASGVFATMDRKFGVAAWRWLFFIEGGLTCIMAIASFHVIPNFPATPASWLTADEHTLAVKRMEEDRGNVEQKNAQRVGLVETLKDWTIWWLAIAEAFVLMGVTYVMFFPTIAATMGYSPTVTLLLCVPPWVVGAVTSVFIMRHSDATRDRFWHIVGPVTLSIIGFLLAIFTMNVFIRYMSLFFMVQSHVASFVVLGWVSNSIPEPSKRAVALAFVNVMGIVGFMGATYWWPAEWGPSYSKSFICCMLSFLISLAMLWAYRRHLIGLNQEAEMKERTLGLPKGFRYIT